MKLRSEVKEFQEGFRQESPAFLMWYLINFFNLSEQAARDAVCDEVNDKGIDGIWVDRFEPEIYIFQAKFSPNDEKNQGDVELREFMGAAGWIENSERIKELMSSNANRHLKAIIKNEKIEDLIDSKAKIRRIFVTNKKLDSNGLQYVTAHKDELECHDIQAIYNKYCLCAEEDPVKKDTTLRLSKASCIEYSIGSSIIVNVFSIQAKELVKLGGIRSGSLFANNIRYSLGRTRVNKDITSTLQKKSLHDKFFLYHNGITIVCEKLVKEDNKVSITNYSVVNGCQSMQTFYDNIDILSDDIYVLTKIIELPAGSAVSIKDITVWTNNQNAISLRDLKAIDTIQIRIQNGFEPYSDKILYRRQEGDYEKGKDSIGIDFAAQLIAAFYLGEPNITYTGDRLFIDRYDEIFSIHMNAPKIYLAYIIYKVIDKNSTVIEYKPIRKYGLAKFALLHMVRQLLTADNNEERIGIGTQIYKDPSSVLTGANLIILENAVEKLFNLMILDLDIFIKDWLKENDNFFDYKNFFKNPDMIKKMSQSIVTSYKKALVHHKEDSFTSIYEKAKADYSRDHLS
jgi:hypothetical protein